MQGWLVLDITDSPFWVGLAAGLQGFGLVGFGIFGGLIVDRFDKRKVLMFSQASTGTIALSVGLLVLFEQIQLWHVLLAATLQGIAMAIQLPASNALLFYTVGPSRLLNAMAARLMAFNFSRLIGSILAGWLLSHVGIWSCYMVAGLASYQAAVILLFLNLSYPPEEKGVPFWQMLVEGVKYAWGNTPIRILLFMSVLMELFGFSHLVMLPVMARDVLDVGASGLGFLSAAGAAGAVVSTLVVAGLGDFKNKLGLLLFTAGAAGISVLFFGLSPWYLVSLCLSALASGALMAYDVTMGTLLQILSTDAVRGRIMGLYGLTFGFTSVGGLLVGAIALITGVPLAVSLGGLSMILYLARPAIYFKRHRLNGTEV